MGIDLREIDYLAFEGGGGMGLAYVGSLAALRDSYNDQGISTVDDLGLFRWPISGVSGASAGAISALMMALDYTPEETANLMVRDGLFARLFSEKIKLEYHRGVVSTDTGAKTGWYGNSKKFGNQTGGLAHLNALIDACCPKPPKETSGSKSPDEGGGSEKDRSALGNFIQMLKNPSDEDPKFWLNQAKAAMKALKLPTSFGDLAPAFLGIFVSAGVRYLGGAGIPNAPDAAERFAKLLNEEATKKLQEIVPTWSVGSSNNSGPAFWGMLAAYPAAALAFLVYILLLQGRVRENRKRDSIKKRQDLGRATLAQTRRVVGKNNADYMIGLLARIWWHNLLNPVFARAIVKQVASLETAKQVYALVLMPELEKPDAEKRKAEQKKALEGLQKTGLSLISLFLKAPITAIAAKALIDDGGLLQGDVTREILTTVVFNKYYVIAGEPGKDWKLVKRGEALETTLSRFANETFDLAAIATAVAQSDAGVTAGSKSRRAAKQDRKATALERAAAKDSDAARNKVLTKVDEYFVLSTALETKGVSLTKKDNADTFGSLGSLEAQIAELRAIATMHNLSGDRTLMPIAEQIRKIKTGLTFARLLTATGKDLVVTGTNISASQPVFFRAALTPDFPVLDAVAISASFPFLFRPTAVCYHGLAGKGRERAFYDKHYSGYFIDGGVFNNLPMNAFNGNQVDGLTGDALCSPPEMLFKEFKCNVLAFELTNDARKEECVFAGGYKAGKKHRDIKAVLTDGLMGSFYAMGGPLQRAQAGMDEQVIRVAPGNLGLFDMVPDYYAIADMFGHNYETAYKFAMDKASPIKGRDAAIRALGDFSKFDSADTSERRDARRAKRAWDKNRQVRKALMQDLR